MINDMQPAIVTMMPTTLKARRKKFRAPCDPSVIQPGTTLHSTNPMIISIIAPNIFIVLFYFSTFHSFLPPM